MPSKTPFYKWAGAYIAAGALAGGYGLYSLLSYDLMPPFLQGRQTWFVDMYDGEFVRAYEQPMSALPEGVVSQNRYAANFDRTTDAGKSLTNPYVGPGVDMDAVIDQGEWNFQTYCAPCHNTNAMGGGAVNDMSDGKKRFPVPAPALAGDASIINAAGYSQGYVYLTIRNGAAIMKGYSWAMTDEEMWSVTEYLKTLDGVNYGAPPAPEAADEAAMEG